MNWTIEELHARMAKAERSARRWFHVIPSRRDWDGVRRMDFQGNFVIDMNPIVRTKLSARRECPQWARIRFDGLMYNPTKEYGGLNDNRYYEREALSPVVAAILRREGWSRYVQDHLPF